MRALRLSLVGAVVLALLAGTGAATVPAPARAADADQPVFETPGVGPGLIVGDAAKQGFEGLRDDGVVSFTDFEDVPTGLHRRLEVRGPGGDFGIGLRTTLMRWPWPPRHPQGAPVAMLPYDFVTEPANHRLMGVVVADVGEGKSKYFPDGQSRFELTVDPPASHVGLSRPWHTNSVTNLYRTDGTLLQSHRNTTMNEFVGYVAATPEDRVRRIEVDGIPEQPDDEYNQLFQVGQVDDLYLGNGPAAASDASAALPPLDPRIGVTEAGGFTGTAEVEEEPAINRETPTDAPVTIHRSELVGLEGVRVALKLLGLAASPRGAEPDPGWDWTSDVGLILMHALLQHALADAKASGRDTSEIEGAVFALALARLLLHEDARAATGATDVTDEPASDPDQPDDTPIEPSKSGIDAMAGSDDATVDGPPGDADLGGPASTFKGEPPKSEDEQTKRMQDQGRVWVQIPAAATITEPDEQERVLKTATWYQVKLDPVGTQVFYDKKGKLLGRNLSPDPVQVRVWVPKEEEEEP